MTALLAAFTIAIAVVPTFALTVAPVIMVQSQQRQRQSLTTSSSSSSRGSRFACCGRRDRAPTTPISSSSLLCRRARRYSLQMVPNDNGGDPPTTTVQGDDDTRRTTTAEQQQQQQPPPPQRRRPRYAGRYPRNFSEKYKEHQGDAAVLDKVLAKGMTPAGTHVPIMLQECMEHLGLLSLLQVEDEHSTLLQQQQQPPSEMGSDVDSQSRRRRLVVDCTLGYGGHSSHILQALAGGGTASRLVALDQDPVELQKTEARLRQQLLLADPQIELTTVHQNFATLGSYLSDHAQLGNVTSLLADLGLSSMQMDDNARGFTYKRQGPLDMRMNNQASQETAFDLLSRLTPKQFQTMLAENSDEVFAAEIAVGLLGSSSKKKKKKAANIPQTTLELSQRTRDIVEPLLVLQQQQRNNNAPNKNNKNMKQQLDSTVARVMQAIRIEVNGEFEALEQLLDDLPAILAPGGGRAVFLTFHSGEDRRVKKAFKAGFKSGTYSSWSRHVVRPSGKERRDNPRSSCCKLRWVVRAGVSDETAQ